MAKYKIAFEINMPSPWPSYFQSIMKLHGVSFNKMHTKKGSKYRLGLSWTNLASPLVTSLLELEAASKVGFSQIVIKGDFFLKVLAGK